MGHAVCVGRAPPAAVYRQQCATSLPPPLPHQNWTYPPFSGAVADGFVWGRGAMDIKARRCGKGARQPRAKATNCLQGELGSFLCTVPCSTCHMTAAPCHVLPAALPQVTVITLLEAATSLLASGWAPQRTLMFAFGQDEEVGGAYGAGERLPDLPLLRLSSCFACHKHALHRAAEQQPGNMLSSPSARHVPDVSTGCMQLWYMAAQQNSGCGGCKHTMRGMQMQ